MRGIVLFCLFVSILMVYSRAAPSEESREKLRDSASRLRETLEKVFQNLREKLKDKLEAYLAQDDLGEKLADVTKIFLERLNQRLQKYVAK
ncbi:unnamed protein product [Dicrocoelium dendriticum]|nr:unnamed protein product [Dicrocoelium dendriticum]